MPYVVSDGIRIHYEVEGDGPPLVLQHGFGQKASSWRLAGYVDVLRPQYRLVLVDARGHVGEADANFPRVQACVEQMPNVTFVSFPGLDHGEAFYRSSLILPEAGKFLQTQRNHVRIAR